MRARGIQRAGRWRAGGLLLLVALLAPGLRGHASELPQEAPDRHEGVSRCASAPCHGSSAAVGQRVLQNESSIWLQHDPHARAYTVLESPLSRRIARNLRLPAPPHETALCLDCHSDHVPPERRGTRFTLEDGVGCEACHGGSERWLEPHHAGNDHAANLALGLYPTDDPLARAELCLSCHFGNARKFVDHRLMGAGHPRLRFELDTFSATQSTPPHYQVDADYAERGKRVSRPIELWAVGQAVTARSLLDALLDPKRGRQGIWPEFVLFDCHACHHPMSQLRWRPRASTGLWAHPGAPRLNDAPLLMLRHAAQAVDPEAGEALRKATLALHAALSRGAGDPARAARRARETVVQLIERLAAWRADVAGVRAIAASLVAEGSADEFRDYAGAEQAAMAVQSIVATLHELGALPPERLAALNRQIERLLTATAEDERYRPEELVAVFRSLAAELGGESRSGASLTVHTSPSASR